MYPKISRLELSSRRFLILLICSIVFLIIKNCFSGTLSHELCSNRNSQLKVLAFDGLSAGCAKNVLGIIYRTADEAVHVSIPACAYLAYQICKPSMLQKMTFVGTLPSITGETLADLSLSINNLRGTIPENMQRKVWNNFDLVYNKLEGYLVESGNATQWSTGGNAVKLNRNRLSGTVPKQYQSAKEDVNMRNLFSCKT